MQNKKYAFKKTTILLALVGALTSQSVHATNWLMLQGTEADHQAPRANVWGFVQAEFQKTDNTLLKAGPGKGSEAAFNQIAPQLSSSQSFNIRRARIGVRGANFPLDNKTNYFLLAEFGNSGITTGDNASQGQLTDASVTFNHIKGARVRAGLFKTPGSEESFQGIATFNYINFTNATDRLLIERSFTNSSDENSRSGPVSAVRDTGIQIFDAFRIGEWEHSYAVMLGNGGGLATTNQDDDLDTYAYASTEKVFGGTTGPRRQGMKFFAWTQNGKRTIDNESGVKRTRSGLGTTYFDGKYRLAAEYITAEGMIYGGTTGARTPENGGTFVVQKEQKADGYYVDLGYRVIPNLELNIRYDLLNSGTAIDAASGTINDAERQFVTTTLGAQYFFNKKTSVRGNYEIRSIEAPNAPEAAPVHTILDGVDNRLSASITMVF
ncbi:MAG: porin [Thiomicrospira sp.]|uniref:porin n=1 Tax=Thiomicrospira sp. TaxID=935 RepID=UPI0019E2786A|nr:porin [Thiomicrospira sp.]MBE0494658.1 porin [Thiomicrospira sp.]